MTLNITVLTPGMIYQSADFRLTNADTGALITDKSAKSVAATYDSWTGFITYTGLGRALNGQDISTLIADWLSDGHDRSMSEVADLLAENGTALLERVRKRLNHKDHIAHTFVIAGFQNDGVHAYVVSNSEDCFGNIATINDRLTVTSRHQRGRGKATVIVTGYNKAVTTSQRRILGTLAVKYPLESGRISRRIEEINTTAASSPVSRSLISKDCIVLSANSDGSGVLHLNNDALETPLYFPHISFGFDVTKAMLEALKSLNIDLSSIRIMQGTSSSTPDPGRPRPSTPATRCPFPVAIDESSNTYTLSEISADDFEPIHATSVNDRCQVAGTGRLGPGHAEASVPWIWKNGQIKRIGYTGSARAINNNGEIAAILTHDGGERVALFDRTLREVMPYGGHLSQFTGSPSSAHAINNSQFIAGVVRGNIVKQGHPNTRAALFHPEHPAILFEEVITDFGSEAIDINENGQLLIVSTHKMFSPLSIIWNPSTGEWWYAGGDKLNVSPISLIDDGRTLGLARNSRTQPVGVICEPHGNWQRLGVPDGWVPTNMNNKGNIVGWASINSLQRPWLRTPSGQITWLPYVREHHTVPVSINNFDYISGTANSDHGWHAAIWAPTK